MVAGHPQIPAYALAAAFFYLGWRGRGAGLKLRLRAGGAMLLGIGMAQALWWPMLLLIGRSTRILHLAAPDNDVVMPWGRLLALIVPGIQGWAGPVALSDDNPFTGYPNNSYFWDTASYIGILPLLAIAGLLIVCVMRKLTPDWRFRYLAWLGAGAFVLSLPLAEPLLHMLPGTLLRSPARMLYLSTFCSAVALGAGVDAVRGIEWPRRWVLNSALAVILALHFADLSWFAHWFIQTNPREEETLPFQATLDREVGSGRIAQEREDTVFSYGDRFDDAGGFDSIFLARFNRGYLALAGEPPETNEQLFDASVLPANALEALGVRFVITTATRKDLALASSTEDAQLYRVANPAPRADFFATDRAEFAPEQQIPSLFAGGSWNRLLLASDAGGYLLAMTPGATGSGRVDYSRPSSDEITVQSSSSAPGFIHVLEAYDPGWTATVDGTASRVLPANGFAMAIPVGAGIHVLRMHYETQGRRTGEGLSLICFLLLVGLVASARSNNIESPIGVL